MNLLSICFMKCAVQMGMGRAGGGERENLLFVLYKTHNVKRVLKFGVEENDVSG